jgi:hypothetical protein
LFLSSIQLEPGKNATRRIWPIAFGGSPVFLHARAWKLGKCAARYLFHVGDGRGLTFYCEVKLVRSIALTGDLLVVVNTFASTPADSSPPNLSILLISDGSQVVSNGDSLSMNRFDANLFVRILNCTIPTGPWGWPRIFRCHWRIWHLDDCSLPLGRRS